MGSQFFLFLGLISLTSFGAWTDIGSDEFSMKPPPKEGSAAYKRDFQILLEEQANRTDEQCDLAASMSIPSFETMFADAGILSKKESSKAGKLVQRAMKLTDKVSAYYKGKFQRPRPYSVDDRIEPCVEKIPGARAYPSAHASMVTTGGCILAALYSDRAEQLREHAASLADLRVTVGVHHPSDVAAGKKLGQDVCERLLEEADFLEELEAVRE